MSDWLHIPERAWIPAGEHIAAIRQRDHTIRSLQAQLKLVNGISSLVPSDYASALVAAYELAFGQSPNGDGGSHGKPSSRPPAHSPQAVRVFTREITYLERRGARNPATSAGEGALARAVDSLERS